MRIVCTGGRGYTNWQRVWRDLNQFHILYGIEYLAEGGQVGLDYWARMWRGRQGVPGDTFPYLSEYGKAGGPKRNEWMLQTVRPDLVLAWPGGDGTNGCIALARQMGFPVELMGEWA